MTGGESERQEHSAANGETPPAQGASADAPADALAQLSEALAAAQAKADENHGLYLRALAEMENVRRRTQEDVSKAHKYAIETFAESLVPVFDSLEKALGDSSANTGALREGVEITLRQLRGAFERGRLTEINPVGEKFDPNRHQAISALAADGTVPANHVVTVLQKGWLIGDRVLRPALVTVVQAG